MTIESNVVLPMPMSERDRQVDPSSQNVPSTQSQPPSQTQVAPMTIVRQKSSFRFSMYCAALVGIINFTVLILALISLAPCLQHSGAACSLLITICALHFVSPFFIFAYRQRSKVFLYGQFPIWIACFIFFMMTTSFDALTVAVNIFHLIAELIAHRDSKVIDFNEPNVEASR
jgi:hypothetical protein